MNSNASPAAATGSLLSDVDTPAGIVDLDALDQNIATAVSLIENIRRGKSPVMLRPHAKAHKSVFIAQRQIAQGRGLTVGVCCQKVSEAEAMVAGGILDVLLSNQVVCPQKIARLVVLAKTARIAVLVDDAENVRALSAAAATGGVCLHVLVELDVGQYRCGVPSIAEAVALGQLVHALPSLTLDGIQAYHGIAQHVRSVEDRQRIVSAVAAKAAATRDAFLAAGLPCGVVTGGGTGTFCLDAATDVFTGEYLCYCILFYLRHRHRRVHG